MRPKVEIIIDKIGGAELDVLSASCGGGQQRPQNYLSFGSGLPHFEVLAQCHTIQGPENGCR